MLSHAGQRISQYDIAGLFGAAYLKTCTMEKAISGFRCIGLRPFKPDIFNEDNFLPSVVTHEPDPDTVARLPAEISTSSQNTDVQNRDKVDQVATSASSTSTPLDQTKTIIVLYMDQSLVAPAQVL